ncbi:hypothetical protein GCM10010123_02230 [Pilimelia anulata]|uniref:Uncharacterized protein n=1 Tax=Pilimelia anulata TaxID=53371 RepID=A0A8J3AYM3_9ACTN|nr:hypothetical protein [Pilimelia anulata]GGJ75850.1 hypothetical protein GCM10010123_02230 [Pilimelia anulata]
MTEHSFYRDDYVILDPRCATAAQREAVYRVLRVNKVTLTVENIATGATLRSDKAAFQPAPREKVDAALKSAAEQPRPPVEAGVLVTVAGPGWNQPPEQLFVVLRDKGDHVALARLGGNSGRYWPKIPIGYCTIVDPATRTAAAEVFLLGNSVGDGAITWDVYATHDAAMAAKELMARTRWPEHAAKHGLPAQPPSDAGELVDQFYGRQPAPGYGQLLRCKVNP